MLVSIVSVLLILLCLYMSTRKPNRFPPGPPRLPIIGSLPYIGPCLMKGILNAFSKYGNVVGFYIGGTPNVAISDYDIIKELMKNDATASRPKLSPFQDLRPGGGVKGILDSENSDWTPGIGFSRGHTWMEQRRFALRVLRDFGFGKSSMENTILDEVDKLCEEISKFNGKELDISLKMNISILNSLWSILTGEKLPLNDPKLQDIVKKFHDFFVKSSDPSAAIASTLPYPPMIRWSILKPFRNVMNLDIESISNAIKGITEIVKEKIESHKSSLNEEDINDFIDAYLVEIQKQDHNKGSSFYRDRGYYYLINVMLDMFVAGMDTTSTTLVWSFLYLLHHPEIKRKVQNEIDTVIGKNRNPSFSDRDDLHYINAFMLESLRITSLAHHALPHYASEDIQLGDYVIPKGSGIFPSLISVMYDPTFFPNPHEFKPERFIGEDGRFKQDEHVIPFGIGKRYCLGQTLAEKEYFLFLVGILQKFDISPAPMEKLPSYHIDETSPPNVLRYCQPYKMIFSLRT